LLPFPKRKSPEELELGDDDLVVLEDVADDVDVELDFRGAEAADVDLAQTVQRKRPSMLLLPSTRPIDERLEDDVAGQCLASIAAEVRSPQSASGIRAVLASAPPPPPILPPPSSVPVAMQVPGQAREEIGASYTIPPHARLPRVTAPPFVRKTTPPSAFARRSSPSLPAMRPAMSTAPMMPLARPATTSEMPPPAVHSIAPTQIGSHVSEARTVEPTVIVVRERPKAGWILASAAIGALCALAAVKILVSPAREEAAPVREVATTTIATAVVAGPAAAPPATSVIVPITPSPVLAHPAPTTSVVAPSAPAATGAVVRFGDEQGIAIAAPKSSASDRVSSSASAKPASAPKSVAPAKAPANAKPAKAPSNALPDGSFPLGQSGESKSATVAAPASTPSQAEKAAQSALASTILSSANTPPGTAPATRSAPASAPEPVAAPAPAPAPRRRALTPEQQIADAQLKASMK